MSVYGKKIVINGVEYVAQKDKDTLDCSGCYFQKKYCGNIEKELKKVFGNDCAKGRYILKKVAPKKNPESTRTGLPSLKRKEINAKKPENKTVIAFAPESAWGKTVENNKSAVIEGQPYLNPLDMMLDNKTVLVDNKPCKIIDSRHECDYVSTKHIVTFEEMPCNLMPVIRCDAASYIVCLSESDGLKPSDVPKQHYSESDAIKEAERLCKKHNQKFVVLKVVAEVEPEIKPKLTKR